MKEKSHYKNSLAHRSLSEESIGLLEWDTLKTQLSSFASTNMGKNAILEFEIPTEYEISKRLLQETIEINELEKNLDKSISFSGVFDICNNIPLVVDWDVVNLMTGETIEKNVSRAKKLASFIASLGIIASITKIAKDFGATIDKIGETFGSLTNLGQEFQSDLLDASVEATALGGGIEDVAAITSTLASNFGVSLDDAAQLSSKIFDTSKALGISSDEASTLFGTLMQTANLSADQAESLAEGAFQLARQNGVAPSAVMKDIAGSAEEIAQFTMDGGDNIVTYKQFMVLEYNGDHGLYLYGSVGDFAFYVLREGIEIPLVVDPRAGTAPPSSDLSGGVTDTTEPDDTLVDNSSITVKQYEPHKLLKDSRLYLLLLA